MIGSAGTGGDFRGLEGYLLHGRDEEGGNRVGWTSVRNLGFPDPRLAALQMEATAAQNYRVQKPVYHLSLNAPPLEHFSREEWEEMADRVLKDLGLSEHQALLVAHTDRAHEHVHLMINRVHPESLKAWSNSHDYARIEKSLRHLERDLGLREVAGHHHQLPGQQRPNRDQGLTSGETQEQLRTGRAPWTDEVRLAVYRDLRDAESWGDLEARLGKHGLKLHEPGRGLVVSDGERQLKVSRIHRGRSGPHLQARYGMSFKEWRRRVATLHEAVEEYERIQERRRAIRRERARLGIRIKKVEEELKPYHEVRRWQKKVEKRLHQQLRTIYGTQLKDKPFNGIRKLGVESSFEHAAEVLRRDPIFLGPLQGKVEPTPDAQRRLALKLVPEAADTVKEWGDVRRMMARVLDHELKREWFSPKPIESEYLEYVRADLENAARKVGELVPTVFRVPQSAEASEPTIVERLTTISNATELVRDLERDPGVFGPLRGRIRDGSPDAERQDAAAHLPALVEAVREHGEYRRTEYALEFSQQELEAPDSFTQARWMMEEAAFEIDKIAQDVFRGEALEEVTDRLKRARLGQEVPHLLRTNPEALGPLAGSESRWLRRPDPERQQALSHIPALADAVQEHSEWREAWLKMLMEKLGEEYREYQKRSRQLLGELHRLPDKVDLLTAIARAARRVGIRAVEHVVPVPAELRYVRSAVHTAASLTRTGRALVKASKLGPANASAGRSSPGQGGETPTTGRVLARAGGRLAMSTGARIAAHLLPLPPQAKAVQMALSTVMEVGRAVVREAGRGR